MFQQFLANQEKAGRSMNDFSNDTWQDIISPPTSSIGDNRPDLAMTEPATTHTNCSLRRQPLNIVGHTLRNCPIIQQLGLRFPDTNPPTNESLNPTTGPPPPPSISQGAADKIE